jgi:hypothetical protein
MRSELPTGTVTFLTDIEGSTRLLHALGPDAYTEALAGAPSAAEGIRLASKMGDGVVVLWGWSASAS